MRDNPLIGSGSDDEVNNWGTRRTNKQKCEGKRPVEQDT